MLQRSHSLGRRLSNPSAISTATRYRIHQSSFPGSAFAAAAAAAYSSACSSSATSSCRHRRRHYLISPSRFSLLFCPRKQPSVMMYTEGLFNGGRTLSTSTTSTSGANKEINSRQSNGNAAQAPSTANGSALDAKDVKQALPEQFASQHFAATNWASPGKTEYNFLSDTSTSGTIPMLQAIIQTTLQDDVFEQDKTTNDLEAWVASLFGHEAGLLMLSGSMGNQLGLRVHLSNPPHSVVADERSHIYQYEAGGVASLSQGMCYSVRPSGGRHYLTLEDVVPHVVLGDNVHHCPTRVISLENTLGGVIMPLAEVRRISTWAREHGVAMHLDGARIWEAVAAQVAQGEHGGDLIAGLRAYAECFDSIQTCFSKGLGAPIGSILVGGRDFIRKARHHRKAIGGGMRATGIIAAPARVAVEETFLKGRLVATHALARRVAARWQARGGKIQLPVDTNMVWLDLPGSGVSADVWQAAVHDEGLIIGESRLVFHYQLSEDAVTRLERAIDKTFEQSSRPTSTTTPTP